MFSNPFDELLRRAESSLNEAMTNSDSLLSKSFMDGYANLIHIVDERSFEDWLNKLDRESETTNAPGDQYREVQPWRYFKNGDSDSLALAKREVCFEMYSALSGDLAKNKTGKIIWRKKPEFEIRLADQHPMPTFRPVSPCVFKGYMRYRIAD